MLKLTLIQVDHSLFSPWNKILLQEVSISNLKKEIFGGVIISVSNYSISRITLQTSKPISEMLRIHWKADFTLNPTAVYRSDHVIQDQCFLLQQFTFSKASGVSTPKGQRSEPPLCTSNCCLFMGNRLSKTAWWRLKLVKHNMHYKNLFIRKSHIHWVSWYHILWPKHCWSDCAFFPHQNIQSCTIISAGKNFTWPPNKMYFHRK